MEKYEDFFSTDFEDTLAARFDVDEQGLCRSIKRTVYPKKGKTPNGSWFTIINNDDDKFRQGIRVEECEWVECHDS